MVFLSLNGIEMNADEYSFEKMVLATAEGKMDKKAIAKYFRAHR